MSRYVNGTGAGKRASFWHRANGSALVEFAILLPVLLILSLPLLNYFHYVQAVQKLNKATTTIADMIALSHKADGLSAQEIDDNPLTLNEERLANMIATVDFLMHPLAFGPNQDALVTAVSVYKDGSAPPHAAWSAEYSGEGNVAVRNGGDLNLVPADFISGMYDQENAIAVRIAYTYHPPIPISPLSFIPSMAETPLSVTQFFPARSGPLRCVYDVNC